MWRERDNAALRGWGKQVGRMRWGRESTSQKRDCFYNRVRAIDMEGRLNVLRTREVKITKDSFLCLFVFVGFIVSSHYLFV